MSSNNEKDNAEKKAAARSRAPASRPGAVSMNRDEAARLDQRIAEKQRGGDSSGASGATAGATATAPPRELGQLEQDLAVKQKGRSSAAAAAGPARPGAFSSASYAAAPASSPGAAASELNDLEADVAAKQRARPSAQPVNSMDQKIAAKMRGNGNNNNDSYTKPAAQLDALESAVQAKMRSNGASSSSGASAAAAGMPSPGARATLTSLEDEVTSKQGAMDSDGGRTQQELNRLDERIRAKNAAASAAASANSQTATPSSLRETEDAVLKKKSGAAAGEGQDMPTKRDGGARAGGHDQHSKDDDGINGGGVGGGGGSDGLGGGLSADSYESSAGTGLGGGNADVEYGEYGGPGEQGLAIAFAVEEEDEDMFIPSAVEYDPDAKPPMHRNRRFRLYAMLAIIVVVIATIGAAVGITLSQDEGPPEVPFRETLGIRENVELLVGAEVLEDSTSPYRKALQWITHEDEQQIEPDHPQFSQRYLAGYFYFATSQKRPWASCGRAQEGESENCIYKKASRGALSDVMFDDFQEKRWLSAVDECTWAGVKCDKSGQFRDLDLSGTGMTGTFPEGVARFPLLQSLTMSFGELEGPLPATLFLTMKHLFEIDLTQNLFTGTIPDVWYESRSLQRIYLEENKIGGQISKNIGKLKDANRLVLADNMLTGPLPDEIGQLSSAWFLRLDSNQLKGTIPTTIGTLEQFASVFLSRNEFSGTIPTEIGLLTKLGDFRISFNRMQGPIPEELYDANKIHYLDLKGNKFTGTISTRIGALTSLTRLIVNDNEFSGVLPSQMGLFLPLKEFHGFGNAFSGTVPIELCEREPDDLVLDCATPVNGVPEIACSCCTSCCNSEGEFCAPRQ